ncbi:hypothetical protein AAIB98_004233 [Providencia rettgeri]|nr:hypothetical protein [Providencia rettgeri]
MTQKKQPSNEGKSQQPSEQKPAPSESSESFTTRRVIVGDSIGGIRKTSK